MYRIFFFPLLIIFALVQNSLAIDDAELLATLNTYPPEVHSAISWKPAFKGDDQKPDFFLSASFQDRGQELVRVDGDTGEVTLVRDIFVGIEGSDPQNFIVAGDTLFFVAKTDEYGRELWKTDGTTAGTLLVKDINIGSDDSNITDLITFQNGNKIAFSAYTPDLGVELYVSNGTNVGTIVFDIYNLPGNGSTPSNLFMHNANQIIFSCSFSGVTEDLCELTDGSSPTVLKSGITSPYGFTKLNITQFVFGGSSVGTGAEIFISDGTETGTSLLKDINAGAGSSSPANFRVLNDQVYFSAFGSGANVGQSLWKSNGTEVETVMVEDLDPTSTDGFFSDFIATSTDILFFASSPSTGTELWKVNGSGASLVRDLTSGTESSMLRDLTPVYTDLTKAFFVFEEEPTSGTEVWVTDGTTGGTKILKDIWTGVEGSNPIIFNNDIDENSFFIANSSVTRELYTTDGTSEQTVSVVDLKFGANLSSDPEEFSLVSENLLFVVAESERYGREPAIVNLTTKEIEFIDINEGTTSSSSTIVARLGNTLIFSANDGINGAELWVTDGTVIGTELLKDINPGSASSSPSLGALLGAQIIFKADDGVNGSELWVTDGTSINTKLLKDINLTGNSNPMSTFAVLANKVIFDASTDTEGVELWITDGTTSGTSLLKDIAVGAFDSSPSKLLLAGDAVYFQADDGATGRELWQTDGTTVGTLLIKDIDSGVASSNPMDFIEYNGDVYFSAETASAGRELWKTDGTNVGTDLVLDLLVGVSSGLSEEQPMAVAGNYLYFSGNSNATGVELYQTSGTEMTTTLVKDIVSGSIGSDVNQIVSAGGQVYFSAESSDFGSELWLSDGTSGGTIIVEDIYFGTESSSPSIFLIDQQAIYFTANNNRVGRELWQVIFDECPDDDAKKVPAVCGCGVVDQDLNGNGVFDCLVEADLEAFIEDSLLASKQIKFNKQNTKKQVNALKAAIKAFKVSVRLVLSEATKDAPNLPELDSKQGKKIRRQLDTNLRAFSRKPSKATRKPVVTELKNLQAL